MSKKYRVLKDLPRASVGSTLETVEKPEYSWAKPGYLKNSQEGFSSFVLDSVLIEDAIESGFIEEIKDGKWRANRGESYFPVSLWTGTSEGNFIGFLYNLTDHYESNDDIRFKDGNYFKSEETAEKVVEAQKLLFEWLHDNDSDEVNDAAYQPGKSMVRLSEAMDIARKAVLKDDQGES